jgi:hypothetical protein
MFSIQIAHQTHFILNERSDVNMTQYQTLRQKFRLFRYRCLRSGHYLAIG